MGATYACVALAIQELAKLSGVGPDLGRSGFRGGAERFREVEPH